MATEMVITVAMVLRPISATTATTARSIRSTKIPESGRTLSCVVPARDWNNPSSLNSFLIGSG